MAECRLRRLHDGRYEYSPKKGTTFTLTAEALASRVRCRELAADRLGLCDEHGRVTELDLG